LHLIFADSANRRATNAEEFSWSVDSPYLCRPLLEVQHIERLRKGRLRVGITLLQLQLWNTDKCGMLKRKRRTKVYKEADSSNKEPRLLIKSRTESYVKSARLLVELAEENLNAGQADELLPCGRINSRGPFDSSRSNSAFRTRLRLPIYP
jgi:hypothetical protein